MDSFEKIFGSTFTDANRTLANTFGGFLDHVVRFEANLPAIGKYAPS
ncbi:hypothetical protein Q5H93_12745 [Hymenobacter sp. ASUV-10]|uniref:Uncharacterized protein n=1 Tax=Hymenobacter aranciens TaxID=3063996 RepID=A0ABT9BD21_9BACT|nr:hypothetical protein [Hymenobacter sp. ASUV-10]MDO7875604.1 hypothetical protein [Hymenobacter sp. ASUV-10]